MAINTGEMRKIMFEHNKVVEVGAKLLDQIDFGMEWKMVHLAFTKCLQPKLHTQSPSTGQEEVMMYLLMQ